MATFLQLLLICIQAALVFFVYRIAIELERIRCYLESQRKNPVQGHHSSSRVILPSARPPVIPILAMWVWRGNAWELDLATVPVGFEAVGPPSFPGIFMGQRVKSECVRC